MISIRTNLSSSIAQTSLSTSTSKLNQAIERLTTGAKINHASDNAANYSIANSMSTKISAYQVAEDNVAMGLDLISTANDSLDLISNNLSRLRALAEQAANGTYGADSLTAINSEANALVDEIERVYNSTQYNGQSILVSDSNFMTEVTTRDTSSMTKLSSVNSSTVLNSGTYSISTAEELAQLATMTNNGLIGRDCEFVLANDIDLSGYDNWTPIGNIDSIQETALIAEKSFQATFDGNGYVVSNLTHTSYNSAYGLFGYMAGTVKNLGIEDCYISGAGNEVGALAGYNIGTIRNCYSTGYVQGTSAVGGLVGNNQAYIDDSYSTCTVVGTGRYINGLFGSGVADFHIQNSCYSGEVIGNDSSGTDYYDPTLGGLADKIANQTTIFQIGISSDSNSQLSVATGILLKNISSLRNIGVGAGDYLSTVDNLISKVTNKQTELGAAQNRLDSALDEISTKYENLVSSRSTLLDTDVAKVTSEYIRQQILQEASATLLATANQSSSIALSLI